MATVPTVPTDHAGMIMPSADLNSLVSAAQWSMAINGSGRPFFWLAKSSTQSLTTSPAAVTWSSAVIDTDSGWSSSHSSQYTVQTAGYWHIDWSVGVSTTDVELICFAEVVTGSSNPFNPSATIEFQYERSASGSGVAVHYSNGGLCPIYLVSGDYIQIMAESASSATTASNPYPTFSGQWVSA